jgi:hypothetical protein
MPLTKKDFIKKAEELATIQDSFARENAITSYIMMAKMSNPRFDEGIFRNYINKRASGKTPSNKIRYSLKKKWVKTDAWRGYEEPVYAIAGVTDTGMWSDSPYPSHKVNPEIDMVQQELRKAGIPTKKITGQTSNVFAGNQYLIAPKDIFPEAKTKVKELLKKKKFEYVWEI